MTMTPPLSYPALKSVLEYVKVEKRIHITSRSRFLQRIDKTLPVRAKLIYIWRDYLRLDSFLFAEKNNHLRAEDKKNGKLLMNYLRGRTNVDVDLAVFTQVKTSQDIPVKLDLKISKLKSDDSNLEVVLPMINPSCFPLTDLSLIINEPSHVDHRIVHLAKNVTFDTNDDLIGLEKLPNKSVYLRVRPITDVVRIITYWMQHGKEVGTEFLIFYFTTSDLREVMTKLQEEFHKAPEYSEEINKHVLPGFSIQLSSMSKLLVYGIGTHVNELVLKVV
ncbi:hypothetical protein CRE_17982 [Caenorhabditis remanei]|uniref:F-box domain-containing protein n=1 Tax=Caenorhabditis remanei TaxID=31234 RepID=E3MDB4_CAERE|nr:hypothetical protein CRE_17982 [Caenorhabditis remanei]